MVGASAQRYSAISILLGLLSLFCLALFCWSIDRGFDISDEGFYMLGFVYPEEYSVQFTNYNMIVAAILPGKSVSLIGYRVASLVVALAAAVFISIGVWQWIRHRALAAVPFQVILLLLTVGSFLPYSLVPRTISYNSLNSLSIAALVGGVLYFCAAPAGRRWLAYAFLALGGLFAGLDLFIKGTSSAANAGMAGIVLILVMGVPNFKRWFIPGVVLVLGYLAGLLLFFVWIQPADVWFTNFNNELRVLSSAYSGGSLVAKYLSNAKPIVKQLVFPFSLLIAGAFGLGRLYRQQPARLSPLVLSVAGVVFAAVFAYGTRRGGLYRNVHLNNNQSAVWFLLAVLVVLALFVALADKKHLSRLSRPTVIVTGWLLALPLICSIGTYNNIFINALLDLNYWLAAICLLYANMPESATDKLLLKVMVFLVPALMTTEQFVYGLLRGPYLQAADTPQQTVPVEVGAVHRSATLKLDAATAGFVQDMRQTLRKAGFQPATPIIAIYDLPGLVYLLDGISPGDPWLFGQRDERSCNSLAKSRLDLRQAFVLVNEPPGQELLRCMQAHGLRFPQGYVKVGTHLNPYAKNRYGWRGYQDTVTVYAPAGGLLPAARTAAR